MDRDVYSTGAERQSQAGRGRYDLLSPIALRRIAARCEIGAEKYAPHNEKRGMPLSRFVDSTLRHIVQYLEGDRGEDHLAAAAWNLSAAMHVEELVTQGGLPSELDDLYQPQEI